MSLLNLSKVDCVPAKFVRTPFIRKFEKEAQVVVSSVESEEKICKESLMNQLRNKLDKHIKSLSVQFCTMEYTSQDWNYTLNCILKQHPRVGNNKSRSQWNNAVQFINAFAVLGILIKRKKLEDDLKEEIETEQTAAEVLADAKDSSLHQVRRNDVKELTFTVWDSISDDSHQVIFSDTNNCVCDCDHWTDELNCKHITFILLKWDKTDLKFIQTAKKLSKQAIANIKHVSTSSPQEHSCCYCLEDLCESNPDIEHLGFRCTACHRFFYHAVCWLHVTSDHREKCPYRCNGTLELAVIPTKKSQRNGVNVAIVHSKSNSNNLSSEKLMKRKIGFAAKRKNMINSAEIKNRHESMKIASAAALSFADYFFPTRSFKDRKSHEDIVQMSLLSMGVDLPLLGSFLVESAEKYRSQKEKFSLKLPRKSIAALLGFRGKLKAYNADIDDSSLVALHSMGLLLQDLAGFFPAVNFASLIEPSIPNNETDIPDPTYCTKHIWNLADLNLHNNIHDNADRDTKWKGETVQGIDGCVLRIGQKRIFAIPDNNNKQRIIPYLNRDHKKYMRYIQGKGGNDVGSILTLYYSYQAYCESYPQVISLFTFLKDHNERFKAFDVTDLEAGKSDYEETEQQENEEDDIKDVEETQEHEEVEVGTVNNNTLIENSNGYGTIENNNRNQRQKVNPYLSNHEDCEMTNNASAPNEEDFL